MFRVRNCEIKKKSGVKKGQTFIEYTLLLGVIVAALIALTPLVRRGTQGMVKLVSDQIGNQAEADQEGGLQGYLVSSSSNTQSDQYKRTAEWIGTTNYIYGGRGIDSTTAAVTNMGYVKTDNPP